MLLSLPPTPSLDPPLLCAEHALAEHVSKALSENPALAGACRLLKAWMLQEPVALSSALSSLALDALCVAWCTGHGEEGGEGGTGPGTPLRGMLAAVERLADVRPGEALGVRVRAPRAACPEEARVWVGGALPGMVGALAAAAQEFLAVCQARSVWPERGIALAVPRHVGRRGVYEWVVEMEGLDVGEVSAMPLMRAHDKRAWLGLTH